MSNTMKLTLDESWQGSSQTARGAYDEHRAACEQQGGAYELPHAEIARLKADLAEARESMITVCRLSANPLTTTEVKARTPTSKPLDVLDAIYDISRTALKQALKGE